MKDNVLTYNIQQSTLEIVILCMEYNKLNCYAMDGCRVGICMQDCRIDSRFSKRILKLRTFYKLILQIVYPAYNKVKAS